MTTSRNAFSAAMLGALFLLSQSASAGQQEGVVTFIGVRHTDGLTYFAVSGTPTGKPACAVYQYWSIPNENSETGKKLYAMLLTARATGQPVQVHGSNTCTRWGDQEDAAAIHWTD